MNLSSFQQNLQVLLQSNLEQERIAASRQLAQWARSEIKLGLFDAYILSLAKALGDSLPEVKFNIAYTLVCLAEKQISVLAAVPELVQILENPNELRTQKEAVWALVCLAAKGEHIGLAQSVLEAFIEQDSNLKGNGTIALALFYLNTAQRASFENLLQASNGHLRFSVAYAATIYGLRTNDYSAFDWVLEHIRAGLPDRDLATGVAAALLWAQDLEISIEEPFRIIKEKAMAAGQEDMMKQLALEGIFMHYSMKKKA